MRDETQARKKAAVKFMQLVVAGRIDEAYETYVDMQGKHHKNVLGDGDLAAVHSHICFGLANQA